MTKEDAIKTLKELWRETHDSWYEEVYTMAIKSLEADRKTELQTEYERASEQMEHDILYEPTYNPEDGSM